MVSRGNSLFQVKTNVLKLFDPSQEVFGTLSPPDKLFSKTVFFLNISKTLEISTTVYENKLVGLLINNNLLAGHTFVSPTVFRIQEFKKSQKTPPPLISRKYCPGCAVQH